jgi:hypothetical protein
MTSIPSANFTPWISFGNWLWPSIRRQLFWAPSASLKTMASAVLLVYAGRAGTGINTAELERLWRRLQPLATGTMPLDVPPPRTSRFGSPLVLSRVRCDASVCRAGRIARAACHLRLNTAKRCRHKIQPIDKSIDKAHRVVRADTIVNHSRRTVAGRAAQNVFLKNCGRRK